MGINVHVHGVRAGRAVLRPANRRGRLRLRRRALGPVGGFATGMAVLIEYAVAPAAIASVHRRVRRSAGPVRPNQLLAGLPDRLRRLRRNPPVRSRRGTQTDVRHHRHRRPLPWSPPWSAWCRSFDPATSSTSRRTAARCERLPSYGHRPACVAALVYGIWFFLAVEGVPLAAEETADPKRDMPRGIIAAILVLAGLRGPDAVVGSGSSRIRSDAGPPTTPCRSDPPAYGGNTILADFVNYAGPGRARGQLLLNHLRLLPAALRPVPRRLPAQVAVADRRRQDPVVALIVPGHHRVRPRRAHRGRRLLINIAVFGATVSYVLLNLSHIVLRRPRTRPAARLPHPGGAVTTGGRLVLCRGGRGGHLRGRCLAAVHHRGLFAAALAYFWFYSRHHLVASAPEEEFAQITEAESELQ